MDEQTLKLCQFCAFWRPLVHSGGEVEGECHRFAPIAQGRGFLNSGMPVTEDIHLAIWVHTKPDDWCGEWKGNKR